MKPRFPQALIYVAADGNSGLEAVRRNLPDIVITGINMPEIDGFQLMDSIAAFKPDNRIIVVTAHCENQIFDKITSLEVPVEIVLKPIVFYALIAAIKRSVIIGTFLGARKGPDRSDSQANDGLQRF